MANIPKMIPACAVDGYKISPQNATVRTEMETGPARQRRLSASMPTQLSVKWIMQRLEFKVFEAWFKHTIFDGTAWFVMEVDNGMGMTETDCRFVGPYTVELAAKGIYNVSATLEVRDMSVMTSEELEEYLD
ncbi:hypothetical protein [Oxalobacter formigenes]|mgnify:FL=1|uniref:Uncharacterized protein n=2 Tax=Oxalobacter formigenes TaxID=847 RepID=C3X7X8_OXAFO|nr:hypothetical protein [Oxalobacter formigenes]ARQ46670.1 hypothetical protein BRW83_1930 [Oxalobacter formigenes]ARQ78741.1 hypothetical protein BRW84_09065 [Oxalobacter formigenes OXCC13]EEO29304.1 hypothetical protein OFBG_00332 [Oxalobacter formigenes OXCC13]QDX32681.1 hypothetical protein FPZ51_03290 [Oxalobacter formigenes]WAW07541.1 hypothetical protein NB638_08395 [Oxalobacter formigenes]